MSRLRFNQAAENRKRKGLGRKSSKKVGTQFEEEIESKLKTLRINSVIGPYWNLTDGAQAVSGPKGIQFIYKKNQPPDILSYFIGSGRLLFIEAKNVGPERASLPVQTEEQARLKKKTSGLKRHQLETLINTERGGGVGLLIVRFETRGVYAFSGNELLAWEERGFHEPKNKSISIDLFDEYGWFLGEDHQWDLARLIQLKAESKPQRIGALRFSRARPNSNSE